MPKPNRPVLQVPQAEARKAIEEQVDQGRKVLASIDLGFPSDLDSKFSRAEKDREKWAKFTIQFLENLFSDDSVAGEFGGWWLNYSEYQDDV